MQDAKKIKENLENLIQNMSKDPSSWAKNPNDFTRNRKLGFNRLLHVMLGMRGNSLNKELYDYFKDSDLITSSAFVQQRNKLKLDAMRYLLKEFNKSCEDKNKYEGYNLLGLDGSKLNIAYNPDDKETYVEQGTQKGYNQLELHALFDLMNKVYIDAVSEPIHITSELSAAINLVNNLTFDNKTILVADRGYGSLNFIQHIMNKSNLDYVIRTRTKNWISEIENLPNKECDVEYELEIHKTQTSKDRLAFKTNPHAKNLSSRQWDFENLKKMKVRIVKFDLGDNNWEILVTSLNKFEFPIEKLKEIYHLRWGIETSFRELKYAIGLVNFHSKKVEFIKQEVYARLIMYNFCERITNCVVIKQDNNRKWTYQVNFTMGIHISIDYFRNKILFDIVETISKYILPIREGRMDKRKLKPKTTVYFLYRVA